MKTFKNHFGIPEDTLVEFLNIPMDEDLEVFIDPFLITNNRSEKDFDAIYNQLKKFFVKLNGDYITSNHKIGGLKFLGNLHEPNEYHLGYSVSNRGKAISGIRADTIFSALRNNLFARSGVSITNEAHSVLLLVSGIGQDIMSDTIANVCRDRFSKFTLEQCVKYGIPTCTFDMYYFDILLNHWDHAKFELPSYKGKPIILLPTKILSSTRSYVNHYNYFVASHYVSKDILNGKIAVTPDGRYIKVLKNGTKLAIIKKIVEYFSKPKADLIDYVLEYNDSLEKFVEYAKEHYPGLDLSDL